MDHENVETAMRQAIAIGVTDYIKSGTLYKGSPILLVMVPAESDLSDLTDYPPGTIAYTAGFASMWQLAADGTWADWGGSNA